MNMRVYEYMNMRVTQKLKGQGVNEILYRDRDQHLDYMAFKICICLDQILTLVKEL